MDEGVAADGADSAEGVSARAGARLRRLAATVVDLLILGPVALFIMLATGVVESAEAWVMPQPIIRLTLLILGSHLLLNGYLLLKAGQTIGKRLCALKIVDARSKNRVPLWRQVLRLYGVAILAGLVALALTVDLGLAFYLISLLSIFGKSQRCLHDYVAGTAVIRS